LALATQTITEVSPTSLRPVGSHARDLALRMLPALLIPALAVLAGCSGEVAANPAQTAFSLSPGTVSIDTNCTGCNATDAHGRPAHQFAATLAGGGAAAVTWSVSGGDATAGPGTISPTGQYTPPTYLTADRVQVTVTAALKANPAIKAASILTLTPGFLRPLTPENLALGPNGTAAITGYLAQAGGGASIYFALADTPTGASGGQGSLSAPHCERSGKAFTACTVTYTAPAAVQTTGVAYIVATAGDSAARTEAAVLLNAAGVASNPASHQGQLATPMQLGSSGGNNSDFDLSGNTIVDCCSGTLGALIQDGGGKQFLLSNNHILARSDHATVGDAIVQPGLIDNNCTPNGEGPGTVPVGSLTAWLQLSSPQTNADAAIAQVASSTVDPTGSILELGTRQPDGTLAAAPPGISSTGGKGEAATLALRVAKSGRTTGLTCGGVSAISVDIAVDYYRDCGETRPYLTRTFTNQIALSGDRFSDAGDSGALVVDAANAEPVGLYFAGGTDASGVSQGVANPAPDLLSELSAQLGSNASFTFVGAADHPVTCLSFGDSTVSAAQGRALSDAEIANVQQGLAVARALVNPDAGILGVAMGKSSDSPGEAAVIVYIDQAAQTVVPATVDGVRTLVIPSTARAVTLGAAPMANTIADAPPLAARALTQALAIKRQWAHNLMQQNPAFFAVGVGQSLDNPRDAALVIYVDRRLLPAQLPQTIGGLRTRYVVMDRMHVTRSYAAPYEPRGHCLPHASKRNFDPASLAAPRSLYLF
jgi:hypothetical protein